MRPFVRVANARRLACVFWYGVQDRGAVGRPLHESEISATAAAIPGALFGPDVCVAGAVASAQRRWHFRTVRRAATASVPRALLVPRLVIGRAIPGAFAGREDEAQRREHMPL